MDFGAYYFGQAPKNALAADPPKSAYVTSTKMDRRIIINADDFGLCDGVNKAVVQAHAMGVLTSATIMTNMPAAVEAVEMAEQLPGLGLGVHLNLLEGRPVSKATCVKCLLDPEGKFALSAARLSVLSVLRNTIRNAIRTELAAQIQWLTERGLRPTHLDSHKHIHGFPVIFTIVCELVRRFKIRAIRWLFEPEGVTREPWPLPTEDGVKRARIIRRMAVINRVQNPRFLKVNALLGVAHAGKIDVDFLKAVTLHNSAEIVEVMTHPGFADGLASCKTRFVQQRQVELKALCDEEIKERFKSSKVNLVHYGQL